MLQANAPVAVYCGSSIGTQKAFACAAESVGNALAAEGHPLVYGGGSKGIMGVVSGAVLRKEGKVIGVIPRAMVAAGGEKDKAQNNEKQVNLNEAGREKVETIIVDSMHERKVEMAKRAEAFIGLPGGLGTFEEVLEVTTWSQLGIHDKPVILINVLSFWDPLRVLIKQSVKAGFINEKNETLIIFVDGPANQEEHETFNWGQATLHALNSWKPGNGVPLFQWHQTQNTTYNST